MVNIIKEFHTTGFIVNDIKPENICLGMYGNTVDNH